MTQAVFWADGVPRSKLASQKQVNAFELLGAAMDISSLFDDKSAANNDRRHSVISGCRQLASGSAVLEQPCLVRRQSLLTAGIYASIKHVAMKKMCLSGKCKPSELSEPSTNHVYVVGNPSRLILHADSP
jgi:hypothetical protein